MSMEDTKLRTNPKQAGAGLFDCRPQTGKCPLDCNQCYYNRSGYYEDINKPHVPSPEEVGDGIVRFNCGHDSNIEKHTVVQLAQRYKHCFFNTSVPRLDFPGPVVLTINPEEEEACRIKPTHFADNGEPPRNLMFVRIRVSASNISLVDTAVYDWAVLDDVPVVLTFMAYYEDDAKPTEVALLDLKIEDCYTWKVRHINEYWCATREFKKQVMERYRELRLVTMCGTLDSNYCKDCMNCASYYWQTRKRLAGS